MLLVVTAQQQGSTSCTIKACMWICKRKKDKKQNKPKRKYKKKCINIVADLILRLGVFFFSTRKMYCATSVLSYWEKVRNFLVFGSVGKQLVFCSERFYFVNSVFFGKIEFLMPLSSAFRQRAAPIKFQFGSCQDPGWALVLSIIPRRAGLVRWQTKRRAMLFVMTLTAVISFSRPQRCLLTKNEAAGHVFVKDMFLVFGRRPRQGTVNKPAIDSINR